MDCNTVGVAEMGREKRERKSRNREEVEEKGGRGGIEKIKTRERGVVLCLIVPWMPRWP